MSPETIKLLLIVFGRSLVNLLAERGKFDQASVLVDALAAVQAGRNIDAALGKLAEAWGTAGEPTLQSITDTRVAIQASMGD